MDDVSDIQHVHSTEMDAFSEIQPDIVPCPASLAPQMQILPQSTVLHVMNLFPAVLSQYMNRLGVTKTRIPTLLSPVDLRKFKLVKIMMIVLMLHI